MSPRRSGRTRGAAQSRINYADVVDEREGEDEEDVGGEGVDVLRQNANAPNVSGEGSERVPRKKKHLSRKSILKDSGTYQEQEDDDEAEDSSLFSMLLPTNTAVALVASDWRAQYAADPTGALAELYTLVARVRRALPLFLYVHARVFESFCVTPSRRCVGKPRARDPTTCRPAAVKRTKM